MQQTRSIYRSREGRTEIHAFYRHVLSTVDYPIGTYEIETSVGRTHIIETGRDGAETMLLLHGSASNSATWLGDIPLWSTRFRVVAADIPGHPGLSEEAPISLSDDTMAGWIDDILQGVGVARVRIVGISLGAWAGLDYAIRHPDRVIALTIIAPSGLAPVKASFIWKAIPMSFLGDRGADWVSRVVFNGADVPEPALRFGRLVARHYRPLKEKPKVFSDSEIRGLSMPVQYIGGQHDALVRTEEAAERLRRLLPEAEVHLLNDQGHAIINQGHSIMAFHETVNG